MLDLLDAELPGRARGVFTTRAGGVSPAPFDRLNLARHTGDDEGRVGANRALLAGALGLPVGGLVFGHQVHGAGVRLVDTSAAQAQPAAGLPETDALVTTTPGLGLVMMGADCLPVVLAADEVVGVVHVGRAGLAAEVLVQTLRVMRAAGAGPVTARIGPGICGRCYEVPAALADEVDRVAPGSRSRTDRGTPSIDLAAGARTQLRQEGVRAVRQVGGCTAEQPGRFFSYRRDGITGRHAGVVWLW